MPTTTERPAEFVHPPFFDGVSFRYVRHVSQQFQVFHDFKLSTNEQNASTYALVSFHTTFVFYVLVVVVTRVV